MSNTITIHMKIWSEAVDTIWTLSNLSIEYGTVKLVSQSLRTKVDGAVDGMQPNDGKLPKVVTGQTDQTGLATGWASQDLSQTRGGQHGLLASAELRANRWLGQA